MDCSFATTRLPAVAFAQAFARLKRRSRAWFTLTTDGPPNMGKATKPVLAM